MISWIPKFKEELGLDEGFERAYKGVLQLDKHFLFNVDSRYPSYPAAIAYIACLHNNQKRTQEDVAKVANCSADALRRRLKEIIKRNKVYVPP